MFKKVLSLILVFSIAFCFCACSGGNPTVEDVSGSEISEITKSIYYANNLTGVENLTVEQTSLRPVGIMINNIKVAQSVQTSVQNADIIYETEVEGGITRLFAVFKDASKIKEIGTIRSARYAYVDLALGHDAIYIHHGQDENYAGPYIKSSGVADFNIDSPYAYRRTNGLSSEHTLYSSGENIVKGITAKGFRTTTEKLDNFANFRKEKDKTAPSYAAATSASVKFSDYTTSVFTYNESTGLYSKNTKGLSNKDYNTGATYDVTNVFFLASDMSHYPIAKYRKIDLNSGTGYYMSAGGYEPITWKKGAGSASFKFYAQDGSELKVNAGNSWVCIYSDDYTPAFSAPETTEKPSSAEIPNTRPSQFS